MATVCTPANDDCEVRVSDGPVVVYFEDGRTDPADVSFDTVEEAEAFVASPKAVGRAYRIDNHGHARGAWMHFVKPSKVHSKVEDVLSENRMLTKVIKKVTDDHGDNSFVWSFDETRNLVVTMLDEKVQRNTKTNLEATLKAEHGDKVRVV